MHREEPLITKTIGLSRNLKLRKGVQNVCIYHTEGGGSRDNGYIEKSLGSKNPLHYLKI